MTSAAAAMRGSEIGNTEVADACRLKHSRHRLIRYVSKRGFVICSKENEAVDRTIIDAVDPIYRTV